MRGFVYTRPAVTAERARMSEQADLVRALHKGCHVAFEEVIDTFKRRLYGVAFRMTRDHAASDDLAQEAFVRLWEHRESLKESLGVFGYLRRTVVNLALNRARRKKVSDKALADRAAKEAARREPSPQDELEMSERREAITQAIESLPDERRAVFVLRVYEEMSYELIAETLDIARGTVMSRLHRARGEIKEALTAFMEEKSRAELQ